MADSIELVIIDPEQQGNEIAGNIPVTHRNISTVDQFRVYFTDLHAFIFILLLFLHSPDQVIHPILKEIKRKKNQIIRVLICGNTNNHFVNNNYIRLVSEPTMNYKITSTFARFIDRKCMKQQCSIDVDRSITLYQQRTQMLDQFYANDRLRVCHILLIPLNATAREVHYAAERVRNICFTLYGNEYRFEIRKLSDYIPEDENNPNKSIRTAYLEKRYRGRICQTIIDSSFIRMYVVGNEPLISNKWSRKMVACELDINQEHNLKYVDRCSFIINRPVDPLYTGNLVPLFSAGSQMQTAVAKTLDEVCSDIFFQDVLPRIHARLENREIYINSSFYRKSLSNPGDTTRLSNEIRSIEQARNSPEERQTSGDITKAML